MIIIMNKDIGIKEGHLFLVFNAFSIEILLVF